MRSRLACGCSDEEILRLGTCLILLKGGQKHGEVGNRNGPRYERGPLLFEPSISDGLIYSLSQPNANQNGIGRTLTT